MNLAIQALAIFSLALPGIILRRAYRRGSFHEAPRPSRPITEEIAYSLVLACILHAGWASMTDAFFWPVDLEATTLLLLGQYGHDSSLLPDVVGALTSHPHRILGYFVTLYGFAYFVGYGFIDVGKLCIKYSEVKDIGVRPVRMTGQEASEESG